MSKKLEKIVVFCMECNASGKLSSCCNADVDDGRCMLCGRFCREETCCDCNGEGNIEYKIGDEVQIFVCVWSEEYLKDQLYEPKQVGDTKTFRGKILEFKDNWTAVVKIPRKGEIRVNIDDIEIN